MVSIILIASIIIVLVVVFIIFILIKTRSRVIIKSKPAMSGYEGDTMFVKEKK